MALAQNVDLTNGPDLPRVSVCLRLGMIMAMSVRRISDHRSIRAIQAATHPRISQSNWVAGRGVLQSLRCSYLFLPVGQTGQRVALRVIERFDRQLDVQVRPVKARRRSGERHAFLVLARARVPAAGPPLSL